MKNSSNFFLLAALTLALFFACQKQELPTAFPCEGCQPSSLADRSAGSILSDTAECVDTVKIVAGLIGMDTCSNDSLPGAADSLCCLFRFIANPLPAGISGLSYSWTLQQLPGGAVQSIGMGSYVDLTMPNTGGVFRICVTVSKPGCPTKRVCRTFVFNPKECTLKWIG